MLRWIIRLAALILGAAVLLFAAAFLLRTDMRPAPDIVAGYRVTTLNVAHRDAPLPVHLWYPAQQGGAPELLGQNALFYGHYVLRDAPQRPGPAPVVVLSHGSGGNAVGLGWLASELARAGMIVVATNHPGTRSRDSDPHRTVHIWERPADMTALLDMLENAPPAGLEPDMSRVASLGFSLGGHSALSLAGLRVSKQMFIEYCTANAGKIDCGWMQAAGVDFDAIDRQRYEQSNRDARVGAVVAVDPALAQAVPADGTGDVAAAALILNLGALADVPVAMRADGLAARITGARHATIPGAWHFSFLSECSRLGEIVIGLTGGDNICSDQGLRPRHEIHAESLALIRPFLAGHLGL